MIEMTENLMVLRFCVPGKRGRQHSLLSPLDYTIAKHAGCQQWGKPVYLDG